MEPLEESAGIEFESQIKGGVISKPFIASVEKRVREELQSGGPLGYPVTDVRVTVADRKMHTVDSKDIAFHMAGRNAVKAALEKGKTKLLEPMEKVKFLVDEKLQCEANSIVARHDGCVSTVNPSEDRPDLTEIEAILPTATIAQVSDALRAESAGEGQFTSVFSHYQPVPDNVMKDFAVGALRP
jgi:elongation factor G